VKSVELGARAGDGACRFRVWAPAAEQVAVRIVAPAAGLVPMERRERGYWEATVAGVEPGALYLFRLNGYHERPDPASRFQPQGVHGPSQVVAADTFPWSDADWPGLALEDYILYELHVGTFSPEGTFAGAITFLDELQELGVTAIELMPVAQFPGDRNWGYDGVFPFAVQNSYGGPEGLKQFVDACHQRGLAVVLDDVYNHLGPEGNCFADFGPYFTDRYHTPWGRALNFDGADSDEVRRFFIENALHWVTEFRVDALRIDAIHGICDFSARPFLAELAEVAHARAAELGRRIYLIPESDLNDPRAVEPRERNGYGLDAMWNDDFHHALHALLTGERNGYYQDFGQLEQLAKAYREGFVFSGQYSPYRRRRHGSSSAHIPAQQFVVFAQNHDQVGNRMRGERLSALVSFEARKLAAGAVLLAPFVPLLFMGEEYGETAPFLYFVSHSDPKLIEAVQQGRRQEFSSFHWQGDPPDPQDESCFEKSKLNRDRSREGQQQTLREFYRELIRLRRSVPALRRLRKKEVEARALEEERVLWVRRGGETEQVLAVFHFGATRRQVTLPLPVGRWRKKLDSAEEHWGGPGSACPEGLESQGRVWLDLQPQSLALLVGADEAES
jgi:maltooligosyltrehalose trehalohydrolase